MLPVGYEDIMHVLWYVNEGGTCVEKGDIFVVLRFNIKWHIQLIFVGNSLNFRSPIKLSCQVECVEGAQISIMINSTKNDIRRKIFFVEFGLVAETETDKCSVNFALPFQGLQEGWTLIRHI